MLTTFATAAAVHQQRAADCAALARRVLFDKIDGIYVRDAQIIFFQRCAADQYARARYLHINEQMTRDRQALEGDYGQFIVCGEEAVT